MDIDTVTYNKAARYKSGYGYGILGKSALRDETNIQSILLHTTNGNKNSTFAGECQYLRDSPEVSSHYIISKTGSVVQILDPKYLAWHSGDCLDNRFENQYSIGIEAHWTPSLGALPQAIIQSYKELCEYLMRRYNRRLLIDCHRNQAIYPEKYLKNGKLVKHPLAGKLGRKVDPSGWTNDQFYAWLKTVQYIEQQFQKYCVIVDVLNIRQGPSIEYAIAGKLSRGDIFESSIVKNDEQNQVINNQSIWLHVTKCIKQDGTDVSNLGFVHASYVQKFSW